jgi:hypothetical protein
MASASKILKNSDNYDDHSHWTVAKQMMTRGHPDRYEPPSEKEFGLDSSNENENENKMTCKLKFPTENLVILFDVSGSVFLMQNKIPSRTPENPNATQNIICAELSGVASYFAFISSTYDLSGVTLHFFTFSDKITYCGAYQITKIRNLYDEIICKLPDLLFGTQIQNNLYACLHRMMQVLGDVNTFSMVLVTDGCEEVHIFEKVKKYLDELQQKVKFYFCVIGAGSVSDSTSLGAPIMISSKKMENGERETNLITRNNDSSEKKNEKLNENSLSTHSMPPTRGTASTNIIEVCNLDYLKELVQYGEQAVYVGSYHRNKHFPFTLRLFMRQIANPGGKSYGPVGLSRYPDNIQKELAIGHSIVTCLHVKIGGSIKNFRYLIIPFYPRDENSFSQENDNFPYIGGVQICLENQSSEYDPAIYYPDVLPVALNLTQSSLYKYSHKKYIKMHEFTARAHPEANEVSFKVSYDQNDYLLIRMLNLF